MNLHNNRSNVGKKIDTEKKKMIWRCIYGIPVTQSLGNQALFKQKER